MAVVLALGLKWPGVVVGFAFCVYGLQQAFQARSAWFVGHYALINYTAAACLIFILLYQFVKRRPSPMKYPTVGWVVWLLLGYAVLSVFWSIDRPVTIANFIGAAPTILVFVVLAPLAVRQPRDLWHAVLALLVIGTGLLLSVVPYMSESRGIVYQAQLAGRQEYTGNPLTIGSLAGYVAIAAVLMNYRGLARILQILRWGVVVLAFYIAVHNARGQTLAAFTVILLLLPFSRDLRRGSGWFAACFGLAVFALVGYWVYGQTSLMNNWDIDTLARVYEGSRLSTSTEALKAWLNEGNFLYWILGAGSSSCYKFIGFYPHLVLAEVLVELGLVGLFLFLTMVFLVGRSVVRMYPLLTPYADARGLLITLAGWFLFEFILSFKEGSLLGNAILLGFAIMLGRLETSLVFNPQRTQPAAPAPANLSVAR